MSTRKPKRIRYVVSPVKRTGTWQLTSKAIHVSEHLTQRAAIDKGVRLCKAHLRIGNLAELIIKGVDGKVRDNRTYGADPRSIKG